MKRYDVLFEEITRQAKAPCDPSKPFKYVDIGVYDGKRAASLIRHWYGLTTRPFAYYGFDLFAELTTREINDAEFSKKRLPPTMAEASATLEAAAIAVTGIRTTIAITPGNTRTTLNDPKTRQILQRADVVNIDGGHSLETIQSDFEAACLFVAPDGTILMDDYYENRDDFGCRRLVDSVAGDPLYAVTIHKDKTDTIPESGLQISYVSVRLERPAAPEPVVEPIVEPVTEPENTNAGTDTDAE